MSQTKNRALHRHIFQLQLEHPCVSATQTSLLASFHRLVLTLFTFLYNNHRFIKALRNFFYVLLFYINSIGLMVAYYKSIFFHISIIFMQQNLMRIVMPSNVFFILKSNIVSIIIILLSSDIRNVSAYKSHLGRNACESQRY